MKVCIETHRPIALRLGQKSLLVRAVHLRRAKEEPKGFDGVSYY